MKKLILLFALTLALSTSASASDVIVANSFSSQIPFNPRDIGSDRTITATFTNGSTTVTVTPALPTALVGKGGYRIGVGAVDPIAGTGLYAAAGTPNATTITLTAPYLGTSGSQSATLYKFVLLRVGVNSAFRPSGSGETVQASNIQSGFFYKEVAVSIINTGSGNVALFPQMTLPSTTDSPTNALAKYSIGFFRPDGSFIVNYSCSGSVTSYSLPPASPTTLAGICDYNAAPFVPSPNTYYTTTQIDNRLPNGSTNQLLYFASPGSILTPLSLGTNLSITGGFLNASGSGGGGGGGGGTLSSLNGLTAADQTFTAANDTNLGLTIGSAGSNHQFNLSWLGTLAKNRQFPTTVYTDQGNTFTTGRQDFRAASFLFLPLAAGASPIQSGAVAVDDTTGFLKVGYGGLSHTHPYYLGNDTGGSSSSGFARFTSDGTLVANAMSFDAGTNTIFGIRNLTTDETYTIGFDQIALNGNPSRTIGTHMLTMKALSGQSGDFARFTDSTGSSLFRVRADGNLTIRGVNYTFPASSAVGTLTNNGSGVLSWSTPATASGSVNWVQQSNGSGGLTADGGHTFDPATAILSVGKSGLTGALQLIGSNGVGVQFKASATTSPQTITWFASLPGSTSFLTVDSTGAIGLSAGGGGGGGIADPGANGILSRTALNTTAARTLTGTAGQIGVVNADGTGGNPTFSLVNTGITSGTYTKLTVDATGRATAGANITANDVSTPVTQGSHGFVSTACGSGGGVCVLRPVFNDTAGAWYSARNDDQAKWATGVVIGVTDSSNFTLATTPGIYTVTGHGLTLSNTYFLADTGGLTATPGSGARQPILIPIDSNRVQILGVMQAASASGGGGGGSLTIQSGGVSQGTATTINFSTGLAASVAAGVATVTASGGGFSGGLNDTGGNGIVVRTALNTTIPRAIAVGSNLSITNPDGVSGNPTISLGSQVLLQSGSFTAGNCPKYNSSGNLIDSGGACGGGGSGSTSLSSLTAPTANLSLTTGTFTVNLQAATALTSTTFRSWTWGINTSGAVSAGLGVVHGWQAEDSSGVVNDLAESGFRWQTHVNANRVSEQIVRMVYSNGSTTQLQDAYVWRPDRLTLLPFDSTSGSTSDLRFRALNGNDVGFKAPDTPASSLIFTLPASVPGGLSAVGSSSVALVIGSGNVLGYRQLQDIITANAPLTFSANVVGCPSCVTQSSNFVTLTGVAFGSLGSPADGTYVFCSTCAPASSPCTGSSTGAWAFRQSGSWKCL